MFFCINMRLLSVTVVIIFVMTTSHCKNINIQRRFTEGEELCRHHQLESDCVKDIEINRSIRSAKNATSSKTGATHLKHKGNFTLVRGRYLRRRLLDESRVKKYSYYYISQKIWMVPLYFMIYYCFYFAALVFKSISRGKARLRNRFTQDKYKLKRSANDYVLNHSLSENFLEYLTPIIMSNIDKFKEKLIADNGR